MANTIKLKRGSGSDPQASDLSIGELAIRTDSGKLFTKKNDGSVAEISGSGGGGISDGDKGDITVSNSGDTFTIDDGVVTSAKIADATIVNGDISASAAIDGSKIQAAGLFNAGVMTAAQNNKLAGIEDNATADMTATEVLSLISGDNIILGEISSTGNSTFAGNITISSSDGGSAAAPELDLNRDSASPADADYIGQIKFTGESDDGSKEVYAKITGKIGDASSGTEDGILEIAHRKAGSNNISARFTSTDLKLINGTGLEVAGDTTITGNLDADGGLDVTGAITSTGNLTISNSAPTINFTDTGDNPDYSIKNLNGVLAITDNTNSTVKFQVDSSDGHVDLPSHVDIGAGLDVTGNISVSGTVDGRDVATDGTKLDGIESGATADQSASEIVALIADQTIAPSTIDMEDDEKIKLGNDDDLEIFHDGDNSFIKDAGTGRLSILTSQLRVNNAADSEIMISATQDDAVELYYNGSKKLSTESDGVKIHAAEGGEAIISLFADEGDNSSDKFRLVASDSAGFEIQSYDGSQYDTLFKGTMNGGAELYHNNSKKFEVSSTGGTLTGTLVATAFTGDLTGDVTGNASGSSGSCTGNAATATALETARTIAGVSFDGTANISLNNNAITNGAGYITGSALNASNLSSGTIPDARFPATLPAVDGSALTGISAGATGGGSDELFYENGQTMTTDYTITNGKNAMCAGPITINSGVTLTIGDGENLVIV